MDMKFYFVTNANGRKLMYAEEPVRLGDLWFGENFEIVWPDELPSGPIKKQILKQSWKDEPLVVKVSFDITSLKIE